MIPPLGVADAAYAAARWGWYLAVFLVLGAGSYAPFLFRARTGLHVTDPEMAAELARRAAGLGLGAALALLVLAIARLYLQARSLLEPGEPVDAVLLRAILESEWGKGWLTQGAMTILAGLAFAAAQRGSRFGWMIAAAAGGGIGFATAMTGHANTSAAGPGGLLLDAAHVWAGGLWLGGLAILLLAGVGALRTVPKERRAPLLRALVADFSRRALVLGPLAIALGVWLAARYLGWSWPFELTSSSYALALGAKLLALVGVGFLGAYNWRISQRRLQHEAGEAGLRRAGALELLFGVILLGITAVLVALPLPEEAL